MKTAFELVREYLYYTNNQLAKLFFHSRSLRSKAQRSNKTIRMPDDLIDRLQKLADQNDISFNQLVVQCCEYAIDNMADSIHPVEG